MASRVAKNPIPIPSGVEIKLAGQDITVKGKQGEMSLHVHPAVKVVQDEQELKVAAANDSRESNALSGTMRALINNLVVGVSEGFTKKLILVGVGYRAKAQGSKLDLTVGMSHPVVIDMPKGITVETPAQTEIVLKGADKQAVAQVAANIRAVRPPEPYKGKGIRYEGEHIVRKEGKKK